MRRYNTHQATALFQRWILLRLVLPPGLHIQGSADAWRFYLRLLYPIVVQ
jgi:hypothetical protein